MSYIWLSWWQTFTRRCQTLASSPLSAYATQVNTLYSTRFIIVSPFYVYSSVYFFLCRLKINHIYSVLCVYRPNFFSELKPQNLKYQSAWSQTHRIVLMVQYVLQHCLNIRSVLTTVLGRLKKGPVWSTLEKWQSILVQVSEYCIISSASASCRFNTKILRAGLLLILIRSTSFR